MTDPKLNQTMQLANGRTLGFAEFGSPEGVPILYFHGNPGSRLELTLFDDLDAALTRLNLRMISVDRPGHRVIRLSARTALCRLADRRG